MLGGSFLFGGITILGTFNFLRRPNIAEHGALQGYVGNQTYCQPVGQLR